MNEKKKKEVRVHMRWMEQEIIRRTELHRDAYFQEQLFDKEIVFHSGLIKTQVRAWLGKKINETQKKALTDIGKSAGFLGSICDIYRMASSRARVEVSAAHEMNNQLGEDLARIRQDLTTARTEAANLREKVRDLEQENKALKGQIGFHEKNN